MLLTINNSRFFFIVREFHLHNKSIFVSFSLIQRDFLCPLSDFFVLHFLIVDPIPALTVVVDVLTIPDLPRKLSMPPEYYILVRWQASPSRLEFLFHTDKYKIILTHVCQYRCVNCTGGGNPVKIEAQQLLPLGDRWPKSGMC